MACDWDRGLITALAMQGAQKGLGAQRKKKGKKKREKKRKREKIGDRTIINCIGLGFAGAGGPGVLPSRWNWGPTDAPSTSGPSLNSGVAWHGPSRALARPLEMLLGPRWGQGPTFNFLISKGPFCPIYNILLSRIIRKKGLNKLPHFARTIGNSIMFYTSYKLTHRTSRPRPKKHEICVYMNKLWINFSPKSENTLEWRPTSSIIIKRLFETLDGPLGSMLSNLF